MPANASPIYTRVGQIDLGTAALLTANTAKDGSGTITVGFTADATNGGFCQYINAKPAGTNVATVCRLFVNNGATNTTITNNSYFKDYSLPAITISETAAQPDIQIPVNLVLPPGYRILLTIGTTVAAGWSFSGVGGKY